LGLVPGSYIPVKPIRILREYTRYRYKLVSCKSSEKNRFVNAFTVCNVALDAVVSDMFGKSASAITDYLISSDSFDPEHCTSLLQKSLKKKANTVIESIKGYQMAKEQKERMVMIRSHLEFIQQSLTKLDEKLDKMVSPYESEITHYSTIPGVDRASAITIISEIGTDLSQFTNSKCLCCWAGLTPDNNESAGKKIRSNNTEISKAFIIPSAVRSLIACLIALSFCLLNISSGISFLYKSLGFHSSPITNILYMEGSIILAIAIMALFSPLRLLTH